MRTGDVNVYEYNRIASLQDAHIAKSRMVVVDGYIGSDPQFRTRARLIMETANANVAGMQKQLYYLVEAGYDPAAWVPDRPTIRTALSWPLTGMILQPACRARPPRS